jgi:predicted N-formylglutamate amidohydrolase
VSGAKSPLPAPFEALNLNGKSPVVLLCEHASNYIPPEYANLGLEPSELGRHIAWDIGVAEVVRHLSRQLDAPAFLGTYSRLLIDLNRPLHASSSIVTRSEATDIPGNVSLSPTEREHRAARFFRPFHNAVEQHLAARITDGQPAVIVAVHSFTPTYHGVSRPWHAGVLYEKAAPFARATIERLSAHDGDSALNVGHNVPYSPSPDEDYGLLIYGDNVGNPAILIEIRQDLLSRPEDHATWANRIAGSLALDVAL